MRYLVLLFVSSFISTIAGQTGILSGSVVEGDQPLGFANIYLVNSDLGAFTDTSGFFEIRNVPKGPFTLEISLLGYEKKIVQGRLTEEEPSQSFKINLDPAISSLSEVVVSGTKRPVKRVDSPIPVEVYSLQYFRANPSPSIFESVQNVNGVRPQINCNVCNTGDIHINGLEGPYTMVLIDGMPIVSGLSTVYGLNGIPQALIDRVEVVKGPASTLYGSEAVAGLINIITKDPAGVASVSVDFMSTSYGELNTDVGLRLRTGQHRSLVGINYFKYGNPVDRNQDGFTDVTLSDRISIFNKWSFLRKNDRTFTLAGRYLYEDRWGGQMEWTKSNRGGDEVYGESIYTNRWEMLGNYQLPLKETFNLEFSANGHRQNSVYGTTNFQARQNVLFSQLTWLKEFGGSSDLLTGLAYRYTYYDDNTPATSGESDDRNNPSKIHLPGLFTQFENTFSARFKTLVGLRYDYNSLHGHILSPRVNLKWNNLDKDLVLRLGGGNGYRVANIFTEDHAALTGARKVVFQGQLKPEKSWNGNFNLVKKFYTNDQRYFGLDFSIFYTYFSNRIIPDYESDPNLIFYKNLEGHAVSQGTSLNFDFSFPSGIQGRIGATLQDVSISEEGEKFRQLLTERFSGVWSISYLIPGAEISFDYSGNVYSPMRLPLLGPLDDRAEFSPWFSIQNLQLKRKYRLFEIYGGVKNFLNFTPPANSIARSFDPFDKNVLFNREGQVIPTPDNPNALTFDPTYVYAPNQGIRFFLGFRYELNP
ncbi:MAG: TonB-dependent receptor [Saprospiraceae bacterium]|nr:TonB-dependent receptor [Saprospiraceae bacterium]